MEEDLRAQVPETSAAGPFRPWTRPGGEQHGQTVETLEPRPQSRLIVRQGGEPQRFGAELMDQGLDHGAVGIRIWWGRGAGASSSPVLAMPTRTGPEGELEGPPGRAVPPPLRSAARFPPEGALPVSRGCLGRRMWSPGRGSTVGSRRSPSWRSCSTGTTASASRGDAGAGHEPHGLPGPRRSARVIAGEEGAEDAAGCAAVHGPHRRAVHGAASRAGSSRSARIAARPGEGIAAASRASASSKGRSPSSSQVLAIAPC